MTERKCPSCDEIKPYADFHKGREKGGTYIYCKACSSSKAKLSYREKRKSPSFLKVRNNRNLKNRYGISTDDVDKMLATQNGSCAICGTTNPGGRTGQFHVDHCHGKGTVRGLLCFNCNSGLGKFADSIDLLNKAISYLERHN